MCTQTSIKGGSSGVVCLDQILKIGDAFAGRMTLYPLSHSRRLDARLLKEEFRESARKHVSGGGVVSGLIVLRLILWLGLVHRLPRFADSPWVGLAFWISHKFLVAISLHT